MNKTAEKLNPVTNFEELGRLERRNRILGRLAINPENRLLNNDALADVFLLLENGDYASVEAQIEKNYQTDMSERSDGKDDKGNKTSEEKPFYITVDYRIEGNDLVADQVASYREMMNGGLEAAWADASSDRDLIYQLKRAQVQAKHADMLLDWYHSGAPYAVRISSLCPPEWEISSSVAKKANFKPERLMASEWIFERTAEGIRMHAFSQDNLTLQALHEINQELGIDDPVAKSTLEEMDKLVKTPFISGIELRDAQRQTHDNYLSRKNGGKYHYGIKVSSLDTVTSNEMVEAKPKTKELWKESVKAIEDSLKMHSVSAGLANIMADLRNGFNGGVVPIELGLKQGNPISIDQARNFMEYLRERAIPQYIFGDPNVVQGSSRVEYGSDYGGIASAGSYAYSNGISYEGDCPTSASQAATPTAQVESAMQVYKNERKNWKWTTGKCRLDECPSRLEKNTEIGPCDFCRGCQYLFDKGMNVNDIKRGYRLNQKTKAKTGFFEIISADLVKYQQEYEEKELARRQKEKLKKQ